MTLEDGWTGVRPGNAARGWTRVALSALVLSQTMLACRSVPRQVAKQDACTGEHTLVVNNKSGTAVDLFAAAQTSPFGRNSGRGGERVVGSAWPGITRLKVTEPSLTYLARRVGDGNLIALSGEQGGNYPVTFAQVCAE
jgi:hypothetical protein